MAQSIEQHEVDRVICALLVQLQRPLSPAGAHCGAPSFLPPLPDLGEAARRPRKKPCERERAQGRIAMRPRLLSVIHPLPYNSAGEGSGEGRSAIFSCPSDSPSLYSLVFLPFGGRERDEQGPKEGYRAQVIFAFLAKLCSNIEGVAARGGEVRSAKKVILCFPSPTRRRIADAAALCIVCTVRRRS